MIFDERTKRLSLSYLAVIMTMSAIFSIIIYVIASSQLGRPFSSRPQWSQGVITDSDFQEIIHERDEQTRLSLGLSLLGLNVAVLLGGGALSYYLARRTLAPIEQVLEKQVQFVNDASHELRTPLTALLTINEVALRKNHLTEEKAREVMRSNIEEVGKLQELSDLLLGLAKADSSGTEDEVVQLDRFAHEVVRNIKAKADDKSVKITVNASQEPAIFAVAPVRQILTILVDNAVKYSQNKGTVQIVVKKHQSAITFRVIDRGIGIPESDTERIFERFYRSDNARTRTSSSGYGLGLAIARGLAEAHGLSISVDSKVGDGSTFTLSIPKM